MAFGFCTTVSLFINDRRQKYFIPVLICISALLLTGKRSQLLVSLFAFLLLYYLYNSDKKMTRFFNICGIVLASILVFDIVVQFVPELATFMEYVLVGDYYLPALKLPRTCPIGRWGMLHKAYLKLRKPAYYQSLLLSGKLDTVLADVEEQATERYEVLIAQMSQREGISEKLKEENQLEWVRRILVVVAFSQPQLTTKNEIGNLFRGSLSHFFVGAILQQTLFFVRYHPLFREIIS